MLVVSLGGSPSLRSRSGVLLERSQRWLQQQGVEVVSYQVRDFPAEDLLHARFDSPKVSVPIDDAWPTPATACASAIGGEAAGGSCSPGAGASSSRSSTAGGRAMSARRASSRS